MRNPRPGSRDGHFESYKSEIAAHAKLDRMMQLDMVPPAVERTYPGDSVSLQLWAENARLLKQLQEQKIAFPATIEMSRQFVRQKVFDDLVANIDENATNMLFDPAWNLILIDHSRCFTNVMTQPFEVGVAGGKGVARSTGVSRSPPALDRDSLNRDIGNFVEGGAVDAILRGATPSSRDSRSRSAKNGEAQVLLPDALVRGLLISEQDR